MVSAGSLVCGYRCLQSLYSPALYFIICTLFGQERLRDFPGRQRSGPRASPFSVIARHPYRQDVAPLGDLNLTAETATVTLLTPRFRLTKETLGRQL